MKLERFKENKTNSKYIIISFGIILLLLAAYGVYKTFAIYKVTKRYDVIRAQIGDFSDTDITIDYTLDGEEITGNIPQKNTGYAANSVTCEKGVTAEWDSTSWGLVNINSNNQKKIKCIVDLSKEELTITYTLQNKSVGTTFPAKTDGYVYDSVTCENGSTASFNTTTWELTNFNRNGVIKASCNVNFSSIVKEYNYTGGMQTFTVPVAGRYHLEAYGASGGAVTPVSGKIGGTGGNGGYVEGTIVLSINRILYIAVGGQGQSCVGQTVSNVSGGYNGGGSANGYAASGGGATTISYITGTIGNGLDATTANQVLLLGPGGGGAGQGGTTYSSYRGGNGAATSGEAKSDGPHASSTSAAGWFSNPINKYNARYGNLGAGGGGGGVLKTFYCSGATCGGDGGVCINNISGGTMQSGVRSGHGYAKITLVSVD